MDQHELLRLALQTMERLHVPYMLVGSYGSSIYGEPRLTQDIDIVIDLTPIDVPEFCTAFAGAGCYLSEPAVQDAVRTQFQFNVLHPASGNKIDFIFPRPDAWGQAQLARRQHVELFPGLTGAVARPEDIILGKLWYYSVGGSEKHLRDISGILNVSGSLVDRDDVAAWAAKLGFTPAWEAVLARIAPEN